MQPLSKPVSDHTPYAINIGSRIPKASIFRFENHWAGHADFLKVVDLHWNSTPYFGNVDKTLSEKLKQVRGGLRSWSKSLSEVKKLIYNSNWSYL